MKVTENEMIVYVDVDGTLCVKGEEIDGRDVPGGYQGDQAYYYGVLHRIDRLYLNIAFLKTLKARGWYIVVHSHNGWQWAKNVVEALELQNYVDEVKSKPFKYVDDQDCHSWMGTRINLHEEKESW